MNYDDYLRQQGGGGGGEVANLQTPAAPVTGDQVKLPNWLSSNPDSNIGELLGSYAGVNAAFDPTQQVQARNDAIAYNTSAGTQAANRASTEYSNRAAQSGAPGLGAGVVRAQALMPVLARNASLRTEASDVAAQTKQQGLSLASQIAQTIGQMRQSYLGTLAQYASSQSQLLTQNNQFNQSNRLEQFRVSQAAQAAQASNRLAAAQAALKLPPAGGYGIANDGSVMYGRHYYNQEQQAIGARSDALAALRGMLPSY